MSLFTFEGDIDTINECQIKLVESVLKKQGFEGGKVAVEPVGQKGDNYIAHVKRFIYKTGDGSTFNMIAKIAPTIQEVRVMMNTVALFNNESVMYELVLPKLDDLQNSAGINEDAKVRFPKCYGVLTEAPYEFILLEDLKESGFEMLDRFQPFTNDSVRLVIKDLAIYHSLSHVFKKAEPETYKEIANKMTNLWILMENDPRSKEFFVKLEEDIKQMMDGDKHKKIISGTLSKIADLGRELHNYEKESKYTVIQQGDCWNNNILFRLEHGKPVQDVMIDYQLSRESNPAADILYLVFNCTNHLTRLEHYKEWIDYYHETLNESLARYGLKANHVYPRDQLDSDLKRYGKMGVALGMLLATMLVRESKDVIDFKELSGDVETVVEESWDQMKSSALEISTVMKLRERIGGIIDSALEFRLV